MLSFTAPIGFSLEANYCPPLPNACSAIPQFVGVNALFDKPSVHDRYQPDFSSLDLFSVLQNVKQQAYCREHSNLLSEIRSLDDLYMRSLFPSSDKEAERTEIANRVAADGFVLALEGRIEEALVKAQFAEELNPSREDVRVFGSLIESKQPTFWQSLANRFQTFGSRLYNLVTWTSNSASLEWRNTAWRADKIQEARNLFEIPKPSTYGERDVCTGSMLFANLREHQEAGFNHRVDDRLRLVERFLGVFGVPSTIDKCSKLVMRRASSPASPYFFYRHLLVEKGYLLALNGTYTEALEWIGLGLYGPYSDEDEILILYKVVAEKAGIAPQNW